MRSEGHTFFRFMAIQKAELDQWFWGITIFDFILLLIVGLIVTHKVAGPIYKLRQTLAKFPEGGAEMKLRESDYIKELSSDIKNLEEKLRKK